MTPGSTKELHNAHSGEQRAGTPDGNPGNPPRASAEGGPEGLGEGRCQDWVGGGCWQGAGRSMEVGRLGWGGEVEAGRQGPSPKQMICTW